MVEKDFVELKKLARLIRNIKAEKYYAIDNNDWSESARQRLRELSYCGDFKVIFDKCKDNMTDHDLQSLYVYADSNLNVLDRFFESPIEFFELQNNKDL